VFNLKALGIKISDKLLSLLKISNTDVLYSIKSTIDFVKALKSLMDYGEIEVEPKGDRGDADAKVIIDGRTIVFQIKSLHSFKSKVMLEIIKSSNDFTKRYLKRFGEFVKAVFIPQQNLKFVPKVIERKKVDANVNVSYGSLLYPVDLLTLWCYRRIADRIRRSYPQLKDVDANYRVAVIDVRTEPINEFILWFMTQSWLIYKGAKYPKLSGVIFMRYNVVRGEHHASMWLIPVINPYADNPLDPSVLLKNVLLPTPTFGSRYLLLLPTHIYISKPSWVEFMQIRPGFRLTYKGIYFGTII